MDTVYTSFLVKRWKRASLYSPAHLQAIFSVCLLKVDLPCKGWPTQCTQLTPLVKHTSILRLSVTGHIFSAQKPTGLTFQEPGEGSHHYKRIPGEQSSIPGENPVLLESGFAKIKEVLPALPVTPGKHGWKNQELQKRIPWNQSCRLVWGKWHWA